MSATLPSLMVVDDEQELAYLFMELLKGSGYDCVSFTDPLQAFNHFMQNSKMFTVVVTSFRKLGLDCTHFAQKITEYNSKVKINLVTAFYSKVNYDIDNVRKVLISKVMQKPVRMTPLRDCVHNLCHLEGNTSN